MIALCQFRENILMAIDALVGDRGRVFELLHGVLKRAWGLCMMCPCILAECLVCARDCYSQVCKAMGMVFVKDEQGQGMAITQPGAPSTADWRLRPIERLLRPVSVCWIPGVHFHGCSEKWASVPSRVGVVDFQCCCVAPNCHAVGLPAGGGYESNATRVCIVHMPHLRMTSMASSRLCIACHTCSLRHVLRQHTVCFRGCAKTHFGDTAYTEFWLLCHPLPATASRTVPSNAPQISKIFEKSLSIPQLSQTP